MNKKHILYIVACIAFVGISTIACAQNQIDKQGRKQGHWIRTDQNGAKIYEGDFKDGLETGTFQYFYPNGTVRIRNTYTTLGRICTHEAFDEQGHMLAKGMYNQKNRDGEWHLFNEEGKLVKIANYRMGIKEGLQVIFNSAGDTAEVSNWKDNHRDGRWWKRIGLKGSITGNFVKGCLEGRLLEYGEDGKLVRDGHYKNGEKDGSYKYFEDGVLTVDENWTDGVLSDRKVLLTTTKKEYISTFAIAYFYPKATTRSIVVKMDGKVLNCQESVETIYSRVGNEQFVTVDKKNRIAACKSCIQGLTKDAEGRDILKLDPTPSFSVFPDEDCMKMIQSLQRVDELDEN